MEFYEGPSKIGQSLNLSHKDATQVMLMTTQVVSERDCWDFHVFQIILALSLFIKHLKTWIIRSWVREVCLSGMQKFTG